MLASINTERTLPFLALVRVVAFLFAASVATLPENAIAQDAAQADPKSHTLKIQVVDEDKEPIEGASVSPHLIEHQQQGNYTFLRLERGKRTNEQGEVEFVFPNSPKGPIARVSIRINHESFVDQHQRVNFDGATDSAVTIVLLRGVQIATSAIDRITKEPIVENLYAMTNQHLPVDWKLKSNGTLISPIIGRDQTSFRLVQIEDGKPTRFSKLVDIAHGEKSRLLVRDLEMTDAVTVTGKLSDDVPRPVKYGMVMACVASISKADQDPRSRLDSWCWKTFARVNKNGTFTLEGIPADSVLQICCSCNGWANKPLTKDEIATEFPKDTNGLLYYQLPQIARIGMQATNITVPMHPVGTLTVKVVDQDDQPFKHALVTFSPRQKFFYWRSNGLSDTSLIRLLRLRPTSENNNAMRRLDFPTKELYSRIKPDRTGTVIIEEVPPGKVSVSASTPEYESGDDEGRVRKVVAVKAEENVEIKLTLNRIEAEDGGDE